MVTPRVAPAEATGGLEANLILPGGVPGGEWSGHADDHAGPALRAGPLSPSHQRSSPSPQDAESTPSPSRKFGPLPGAQHVLRSDPRRRRRGDTKPWAFVP